MGSELGSDQFEEMEELIANRLNDAHNTKKTLFTMAKVYNYLGTTLNISIIVLTSALSFNLVSNIYSRINPFLAVLAAILSFASLYFKFDKKALLAESSAEDYNQFAKEFEKFYALDFTDPETPKQDKKQRLEEMASRYNDLNQQSLSTTDWAYKRVDPSDVLGNIETTQEEKEILLNNKG